MGKVKIGIHGLKGMGLPVGMMMARVGMMMALEPDIEVVVVNDTTITNQSNMFHCEQGRLNCRGHNVMVENSNTLLLGEKAFTLFEIRKPEEIPWSVAGAEVIFDFTDEGNTAAHFKGGAKKVIVLPVSNEAFVFLVSRASCSTDPLEKVGNEWVGIIMDLKSISFTFKDKETFDLPSSSNYGVVREALLYITEKKTFFGHPAAITP